MTGSPRPSTLCRILTLTLVAAAVLAWGGIAEASTFTVRNNCSYTVYPGIYPPVYANGGWSMAPGASVSFNPGAFTGRIWGRTGCNSASPAQCATGQCGGTGLQCAGTTGQAGTSLAEFNFNAGATDWYNVSYVDGFDNPVGVTVSNGSCYSPSTCKSAPLTSCPAELRVGGYCLSPCTRYNTDQYCCRGAYGTQATCVVANWAGFAQNYVNNIHGACPRQYAYAYDEGSGALHTCPTGPNYTITFCPSGGGTPPPPPPPPPPGGTVTSINSSAWYQVINTNSGRCTDDAGWSQANGARVIQWTCGAGQANQQWQFVPTSGGYYRVMVRHATWLGWDVTGGPGATGQGVPVQLWGVGSPAGNNQQWLPQHLGNGIWRFVARHSGRCLDVPSSSTANGVQLQQWTCNGTGAQSFRLVQQ
jgi:hypothetical protein